MITLNVGSVKVRIDATNLTEKDLNKLSSEIQATINRTLETLTDELNSYLVTNVIEYEVAWDC